MGEYSTIDKAKKLICAFLEEELPYAEGSVAVKVACEYLGMVAVLGDPSLSNMALHGCIALCRDAEKRVRALYENYIVNAND